MNLAGSLLELAVRTLPERLRPRYREEWLTDLERAPEAGLSRAAVVLGALSFSIRLDRDDVAVTGVPAAQATRRRAGWAAAFGLGALILAFGVFRSVLQGFAPRPSGGAAGVTSVLVFVLIGGLAVLGLVAGSAALRVGLPALGARRIARMVLTGGIAVLSVTMIAALPFGGDLTALAVLGVILFRATADPPGTVPARSARVLLAAVFSVLTWAVVVVGALHILVWTPLAKLPEMPLAEIYAEIAATGDPNGVALVAVWAGSFLAAAVAFPIWFGRRGVRPTRSIVVAGALLVATAGLTQPYAGFLTGMAVADAFYVSGGEAAPSAVVLTAVSLAALIVAFFAAFVPPALHVSADPAVVR